MSSHALGLARNATRIAAAATAFTLATVLGGTANAVVVDFEGTAEGARIDASALPPGVSIAVDSDRPGHESAAIVFDSACDPGCTGGDPDLQTPGFGTGNDTPQGNVVIIAESLVDIDPADGLVDEPDDEKRGGTITFTFEEPLAVSSLRVIDIDENETTGFAELALAGGGVAREPLAPLGHNSAQTITFEGAPLATALRIRLPGSGAIDDVVIETPATTTTTLPGGTTTTSTTVEPGTTTTVEPGTTTTVDASTTTTVDTSTTTLPVTTTTTLPPEPGCGDGVLDEGEECDDGNQSDFDACPSTCRNARCGDGFVHLPVEECDDGNDVAGDGCSPQCELDGICGDVNGDLQVTATDAQLVLAGTVSSLVHCPSAACDVDRNGNVNSTDALGTLRLAVGLADQGICERPVLVIFRLFDAIEIGAIHFAVEYEGLPAAPAGDADGVACSVLVEEALGVFNDNAAETSLQAAMASVPGIAGPRDLASCVFIQHGPRAPLELDVRTIEATSPDQAPLAEVTVVGSAVLCGDGIVQTPEACDDGNDVAGDGCSPECEADGECAEPSAPECTGPVTVAFRLLDAVTIGAVQFNVSYDGLPGAFAGDGADVECTALVPEAQASFGHHPAQQELRAAMATLEDVVGPADLAECTFVRTGGGPLGFRIAVIDAAAPDVQPIAAATVAAEIR